MVGPPVRNGDHAELAGPDHRADDGSFMRCPLCAGPLTRRDADLFSCEVGHELSDVELRQAATARATVALWMAIEALGSEASALRRLAASEGDDGIFRAMAGQAEADERLLRELATSHDATTGDVEAALEL